MTNIPQSPFIGNITIPRVVQPTIPQIAQPTVPKVAQPTVPRVNQPAVPRITHPTVPRVVQPTAPTVPRITQPIVPTVPRIVQPTVPTVAQPPRVTQTVVDNYYHQDDPRPEEFKFRATPENTEFIQTTIQTARELFPSLETHIQVAEIANILTDLRRRTQYPSYMRDASPFEIYKIYEGQAAGSAREFLSGLNEITQWGINLDRIPQEQTNFAYELRQQGITDRGEIIRRLRERFPRRERDFGDYLDLMRQMIKDVLVVQKDLRMRELYGDNYQQIGILIMAEMQRRGYNGQYIGFITNNLPAGQARYNDFLITPDNFVATITPDQAILMEEWRKEALRGGVNSLKNLDLLGLRPITEEYNPQLQDYPERHHAPVLQTIGYSKERLRNAVMAVADRLAPGRIRQPAPGRHRDRPGLPITRNYIRYEGEKAEYVCERKTIDISNEGLPMDQGMSKAYYMMLYNELRIRGLFDGTQF